MKKFLCYFILEFAIIFGVSYGANALIRGVMTVPSMAVSAAAGGAIIAYAIAASGKNKVCWWKKNVIQSGAKADGGVGDPMK